MTGVYRKWGRVVRYENGVIVHVEEAGEASETDGVFRAKPAQTRVSVPHLQAREVEAFVAQTLLPVRPSVVERLIVSAGIARHETNGVIWTEESRRVHVALINPLINPPLRVLIDLASFDIGVIETIADALARAGDERAAPSHIRLAPNVSAALLPALAGELAMEQTGGGFDGKGQPIETRAVTSDPPPNWYRPGYAVRPVRAWQTSARCRLGASMRAHRSRWHCWHPSTGRSLGFSASTVMRSSPRRSMQHASVPSPAVSRRGTPMKLVRSARR